MWLGEQFETEGSDILVIPLAGSTQFRFLFADQGRILMLVLSRKQGQNLRIGDEIELQVLSVRNGRVRIGITCPAAVGIVPAEPTFREGCTPGDGSAASNTHSAPARDDLMKTERVA